MRISIGIPTINRADLLKTLMDDLSKNMIDEIVDFVVVDNGNQNIIIPDNLPNNIIRTEKNQGYGGSLNIIINRAFRDPSIDHVLIPSDDIIIGKKVIEQLPETFNDNTGYDILIGECIWSLVSISRDCWNEVGEFDTVFYPAYYEDCDYEYRAKLLNRSLTLDPRLNPEFFGREGSIKVNRQLNRGSILRQIYTQKWGGHNRTFETYKTPYNGNEELIAHYKQVGRMNLGLE